MSDIIAITGQIGAGKSTLSKKLVEHNYPVIDADTLAQYVLIKYIDAVNDIAGIDVSLEHFPYVDRVTLGQMIFNDYEKKAKIEKLVHPLVHQKFLEKKEMLAGTFKIIFYDVPLLFESGYLDKIKPDLIIIIDAPVSLRMERCMKTRGYTKEEFERRNNLQMRVNEKRFLCPSAVVIQNSGTEDELYDNVMKQVKREKS